MVKYRNLVDRIESSSASLSVILPSYNERGNLKPVTRGILRQGLGVTEIVVVNDGSPDIALEHGKRISLSDAQIRLISRKAERELAAAEGVSTESRDVIARMDCDLSHPVQLLNTLPDTIGEADIALTAYYVRGQEPTGL